MVGGGGKEFSEEKDQHYAKLVVTVTTVNSNSVNIT
jgi:hypothetical protein